MAKKVKAKIYGVAEVPCVRTGKTEHVLDVAVGDYVYPLHITELWKEVQVDDGKNGGKKNGSVGKHAVQISS